MERDNKKLWVDLLGWSSAWKILRLARRKEILEVRYINSVKSFLPWLPAFRKMVGKPVVQVCDIVESELKIEGMSLYEYIHLSVNDVVEAWSLKKETSAYIESFCRLYGANPDKFCAHLKEKAFFRVFRPVSLLAYARCLSKEKDIFLIHSSPFRRLFKELFKSYEIHFYPLGLLRTSQVDTRPKYIYDTYGKDEYFSGATVTIGAMVGSWLINIISGVIVALMPWRKARGSEAVRIGVELTQHRVRPDEINDVSWLAGLGEDSRHVIYLQLGGQYDEESLRVLDSLGAARCRVVRNPYLIVKQTLGLAKDDRHRLIAADLGFSPVTLPWIVRMLATWFLQGQNGWLRFQGAAYMCRTLFWMSIYRQLGVKVLFTMFDTDEDKLPKGQATEFLGGLYCGGHWSNYLFYKIDNHKCFDVVFAWGEHFVKSSFNRYPHDAIFLTGYICDYYFEDHKKQAEQLRQKYPGKFILSYHDNAMANDIACSLDMQLDMHRMLLSLLRKFENLVVFLKPKRKFVWEEMLEALPEFHHFIREGRVAVFLGETERTKAVPAQIGMASDLVLGLGISTSAAEAFFAGSIAFHADLTAFERNEFANRGLGVIVFRDIFSLENAVMDCLRRKNTLKHADYRGYYTCLDPFQDGWSAKRIGFIMKRIREYLAQGMDRRLLLNKVSQDYDVYLTTMTNLQKMSWN